MPDLCSEHVRHQIGHGPHAFADLCFALQAAGEAYVDVPVFVGVDPRLALHGAFRRDGAGFHAGVDLITCAVEEAGIDKHHALAGTVNALGEVHCGAALFVHDADLERIARQSEQVLNSSKQRYRQADFVGAVHFRFHDIHRAGSRVLLRALAAEVMERTECREQTVHEPLRDFLALGIENRGVGHEVADVSDEQQAAAGQRQGAAIG